MNLKSFLVILGLFFSFSAFATEKPLIRLGVLAFGTVNWELAALENKGLLETADFELQIQKLANPQAGKIALQSNAVDMIVSDWIWVSRLRSIGEDFTFYPYSNTSGALLIPADSGIKSITDLNGKKLGIAGGELDKNWLLLKAVAQQQSIDLDKTVTKVYGAPPLLNQQLSSGRVDAVINYWHFAARLEAQGYVQLLDGKALLKNLGIEEAVPTLGYVFRQDWASGHKQAVNSFLETTKAGKDRLCTDDAAWNKVLPLTKAKDLPTQAKLRERYCAGRIQQWGDAQKRAAERIYQLLRKLSSNKLTGDSKTLQAGTFYAK